MSIRKDVNQTIKFACEELSKYLTKMGNGDSRSIRVGLFSDFQIKPQVKDNNAFDDEIFIDIRSGEGVIAGINPRSVLIAVYRFLSEAGCMWVHPGEAGEHIPHRPIEDITVNIHEDASYRHRGICIEGANNYQNILDIID